MQAFTFPFFEERSRNHATHNLYFIHTYIYVYFILSCDFYSIRYIMYLTMYSFQIKLSISEITNYTKNKIMPLNMQQKERGRVRF